MKVIGCGTETYLYINGISTSNEILLHDNVVLIPVTKHFHYGKVSKLLKDTMLEPLLHALCQNIEYPFQFLEYPCIGVNPSASKKP